MTAALSAKSDEALVAMARDPDNLQETYPGELQRRLLASNRELTAALHAFKASSDTASNRLLRLTRVLIFLTAALVLLTVVLVGPAWRAWRPSPGRETAGVNGLLWVYLLGGILEIAGIVYTGMIGLKVVRFGGLPRLWYPKPWQVWVALGLVLSGVVVGVVGNVASLYVR